MKQLAQDERLCRLPTVAMGSSHDTKQIVRCLRCGASDYLVKPLRGNELQNLWTHVWRQRRLGAAAPLLTDGNDSEESGDTNCLTLDGNPRFNQHVFAAGKGKEEAGPGGSGSDEDKKGGSGGSGNEAAGEAAAARREHLRAGKGGAKKAPKPRGHNSNSAEDGSNSGSFGNPLGGATGGKGADAAIEAGHGVKAAQRSGRGRRRGTSVQASAPAAVAGTPTNGNGGSNTGNGGNGDSGGNGAGNGNGFSHTGHRNGGNGNGGNAHGTAMSAYHALTGSAALNAVPAPMSMQPTPQQQQQQQQQQPTRQQPMRRRRGQYQHRQGGTVQVVAPGEGKGSDGGSDGNGSGGNGSDGKGSGNASLTGAVERGNKSGSRSPVDDTAVPKTTAADKGKGRSQSPDEAAAGHVRVGVTTRAKRPRASSANPGSSAFNAYPDPLGTTSASEHMQRTRSSKRAKSGTPDTDAAAGNGDGADRPKAPTAQQPSGGSGGRSGPSSIAEAADAAGAGTGVVEGGAAAAADAKLQSAMRRQPLQVRPPVAPMQAPTYADYAIAVQAQLQAQQQAQQVQVRTNLPHKMKTQPYHRHKIAGRGQGVSGTSST